MTSLETAENRETLHGVQNTLRLLLAVAVAALAVGVWSLWDIARIQDSRALARHSACIQANVEINNARQTNIASIRALLGIDPDLTAEQRTSFLAVYTAGLTRTRPYRDCSAAGLAVYYKHPPKDPATP